MKKSQWGEIPMGVGAIDAALGGGLAPGAISHIYGSGGVGKTTLALQFVVALGQRGGTTLYLSTHSNFVSRLTQIAGTQFPQLGNRVIVFQPETFMEQSTIIDRLDAFISTSVGLIVVDTLTGHYRSALTSRQQTIRLHHELNRQIGFLLNLAREYHLAVLVVNEATQRPDDPTILPAARTVINYWSTYTLQLLHTDPPQMKVRQLTIKTPHRRKTLKVHLTNQGLEV